MEASNPLQTFFDYCGKKVISDPFSPSAVERYIFDQWGRGLKKASPEGFRSAFRKFCILCEKADPFSPKINLMIDAFHCDYPALQKKFLCVGDLAKLVGAVGESNDFEDIVELIFFCVWQNVRIGTLMNIKFNDIFVESGGIWLVKVKGHKVPIWTILHPAVEPIVARRLKRCGGDPNSLLVGNRSEKELNSLLKNLAKCAGVRINSWHDLRHIASQYMNDLSYPNVIMQALGTWKAPHSLKVYVRGRRALLFDESTRAMHANYLSILNRRLSSLKGKMGWLKSCDAASGTKRDLHRV